MSDTKPRAPKGFTKAKREEFLDEVRQGQRPGAAAQFLGFNRAEILKYIDSDPAFATEVHYAEVEATELVEEALFQAAVSGNVPASKVWLEMRGKMPQGGQNSGNGPSPAAPGPGAFDELDDVIPLDTARRRR